MKILMFYGFKCFNIDNYIDNINCFPNYWHSYWNINNQTAVMQNPNNIGGKKKWKPSSPSPTLSSTPFSGLCNQ